MIGRFSVEWLFGYLGPRTASICHNLFRVIAPSGHSQLMSPLAINVAVLRLERLNKL